MAITTMLWATDGTGDGTANGYTDAQVQRLFRGLHLNDPEIQGVLAGQDNELAVTTPGANQISVATGQALIYGLHLYNDAPVALAPSSPAATTGGIVYAAVDWSTKTGAINFRQNTSGNTDIPALTQNAGTAWEIPLASYQITSGGAITLTDLRRFTGGALAINRQGGSATDWSWVGSDNYLAQPAKMQAGAGNCNSSGIATIAYPEAFSSAPLVFVMPDSAVEGGPILIARAHSITSSQFEVQVVNGSLSNPGAVSFAWLAIGPR